jgi:hypothetical protein
MSRSLVGNFNQAWAVDPLGEYEQVEPPTFNASSVRRAATGACDRVSQAIKGYVAFRFFRTSGPDEYIAYPYAIPAPLRLRAPEPYSP